MAEKILVIGMSSDCGGIENYILNVYQHIDRKKLQFDFLVKEYVGDEFQKRITDLGGKVFQVGTFKKRMVSSWRKMRQIYSSNDYKKVYVNLSYFPTLIYVLPSIGRGITDVYIHSHASDDNRKARHYFFRRLLFPILKKNFKLHYMGCSEESCIWMFGLKECNRCGITVVNNAIDYDLFKYDNNQAEKIRGKLGIKDEFIVGHVGRFSGEKNHDFIIKAFSELHKINKNTKLLLLGDGDLKDHIENMISEYGLSRDVVTTGVVEDPYNYYNAMDCFWLPSLFEGLPVVAIEAAINGLHCILSDRITPKTDILGNMDFISIESVEGFVEKTLSIRKGYDRSVNRNTISQKGYDIEIEALKIQGLFLMNDSLK